MNIIENKDALNKEIARFLSAERSRDSWWAINAYFLQINKKALKTRVFLCLFLTFYEYLLFQGGILYHR